MNRDLPFAAAGAVACACVIGYVITGDLRWLAGLCACSVLAAWGESSRRKRDRARRIIAEARRSAWGMPLDHPDIPAPLAGLPRRIPLGDTVPDEWVAEYRERP